MIIITFCDFGHQKNQRQGFLIDISINRKAKVCSMTKAFVIQINCKYPKFSFFEKQSINSWLECVQKKSSWFKLLNWELNALSEPIFFDFYFNFLSFLGFLNYYLKSEWDKLWLQHNNLLHADYANVYRSSLPFAIKDNSKSNGSMRKHYLDNKVTSKLYMMAKKVIFDYLFQFTLIQSCNFWGFEL